LSASEMNHLRFTYPEIIRTGFPLNFDANGIKTPEEIEASKEASKETIVLKETADQIGEKDESHAKTEG
ncbi:MAG: hypothetical protein IKL38_05870, partial [Firmicutes bacterium]|nr:hypothetical protein [Bacillota bacterium]